MFLIRSLKNSHLILLLRRNFASNLITIEVGIHSQPFKSPYQKCGLYQISYSPHPTSMKIKALLSLIRPFKVIPIFYDGPDIRHITAKLCSVKLDDDVTEVVEISDSGDENGIYIHTAYRTQNYERFANDYYF